MRVEAARNSPRGQKCSQHNGEGVALRPTLITFAVWLGVIVPGLGSRCPSRNGSQICNIYRPQARNSIVRPRSDCIPAAEALLNYFQTLV